MVRITVRGHFSRARFIAAARVISSSAGLAGVSFASVATLLGTSRSAVQRQFPTAHALRRAVLEEWGAHVERLCGRRRPDGVSAVWELLYDWLVLYARHPLPVDALRPAAAAGESPESAELRTLATAAVTRWQRALETQVSRAVWPPGTDWRRLSTQLLVSSLGIGSAAAVLGDAPALEAAAWSCWNTLQQATAGAAELPTLTEALEPLGRGVARGIGLRPGLERVREDSAVAEQVRPRRGDANTHAPRAARTKAPAKTWDDFLAEAKRELEEYRRKHPEEFEDRWP